MDDFKTRFILSEIHEDEKRVKIAFIIIGLFLVILLASVAYLALQSVNNQKAASTTNQTALSPSTIPTPTISPTPIVTITESPLSPTPIVIVKEPAIKDYFIPFGSGTDQTSDWADVSALQATIDFDNYPNIKEVRFEVSVNIPTANQTASVRLFNKTDQHPVWNSEVTTTNNVYTVSQPIIYDKGSKTYQVQMKTQLQYLANLDLARLHIILK